LSALHPGLEVLQADELARAEPLAKLVEAEDVIQGPRGAKALAVQEIAEIHTLAELRQVQPIALPGGGEVRLGLAESGTDGGPWKLLYCLEKHTGAPMPRYYDEGPGERTALGSVYFTVKPPPLDIGRQAQREEELLADRVAYLRQQSAYANEPLYCGQVVTALRGTYEIRVYASNGQLIQRKKLQVMSPRSCYWLELADWGGERMARDPVEALPKFKGDSPIARVGDDVLLFGRYLFRLPGLLQPGDGAPTANPLPGGIPVNDRLAQAFHMDAPRPGEPPCHLQIYMESDDLVIRSRAVDLEDWEIERPFLARWWLNGQSVVPAHFALLAEEHVQRARAVRQRVQEMADSRQEPRLTERRYRFVLPHIFSSLRVGDRLELQVLYCPQEYDRLFETVFGEERLHGRAMLMDELSQSHVPLLSNRLEFTVTDANPDEPKVKPRPGHLPLPAIDEQGF